MDAAHRYTNKKIVRLQKELERIYLEAEKDVNRKLKEFNKRHATKEKKLLEKLAKGEISRDEFGRWERGQVFIGERWKAQREQILDSMRNANRIAMEIINGYALDAFRINSNYMSYTLEKLGGVNFGFEIYDKSTIVRLIRKYPDLLPKWKIDEPKDYAWSKRKLNNQIIQGITQGESLDDIAKRISKKLSSLNKNKMRTFARTAMTSAQNGGRMAQMKRAQEMGIELEKEWIATLDSHTRDSHADVDGEKVPVDRKFSNGLMYPAEAGGAPAEVYNCFIPETNIGVDSKIIRSYKHRYEGEVISIKSSVGVEFTCTPNHPILTNRGWVAAKLLHEGDYLVVTRGVDHEVSRRNPNINHAFPRIDAIHELFYKLGGERTSTLSVNFHGDIPASEVEIVTQKRFLRNNRNVCIGKCFNKFILKLADKPFVCKCSFMEHFGRIMRTTFGNIRRVSKSLPFFKRCLRHSGVHGFGFVSNVNASFSKYSVNNLPTNSIFVSESLNGLTDKVFLDKIITVNRSVFTGHVYNLQTENNYYFTNSLSKNSQSCNDIFAIAHNCRCTMGCELKKYPSKYTQRWDNENGKRISDITYKEWEKSKK